VCSSRSGAPLHTASPEMTQRTQNQANTHPVCRHDTNAVTGQVLKQTDSHGRVTHLQPPPATRPQPRIRAACPQARGLRARALHPLTLRCGSAR
jgi:hypothetical protein